MPDASAVAGEDTDEGAKEEDTGGPVGLRSCELLDQRETKAPEDWVVV